VKRVVTSQLVMKRHETLTHDNVRSSAQVRLEKLSNWLTLFMNLHNKHMTGFDLRETQMEV